MEVTMAEENPLKEDASPPPKEKKGLAPVAIIGIIVLVLFIGLWLVLYFLPDTVVAKMRDVSLAIMSVGMFLSLLLTVAILAVVIWGFHRLSVRLDDLLERGGAVLDQVKGTATTVKGTADFVGERVASPFIRISAWFSGIGQGIATFFRGEESTGGSQ
jgi:hypothetical protein